MSTDISRASAWAEQFDFDDPGASVEDRQDALRALLTQRINATAQPSRLINQLHAADLRCTAAAKVLKRLLELSPRILRVLGKPLPLVAADLPALQRSASAYWQQLAYGSWLTRRQRWVALRKALFVDQAFMAHQVYQLSADALELLRQLADAPTAEARQCAGGAWAGVQVAKLWWPGVHQAQVPIPGALHIYREDALQVIYLPGLVREFHEFTSWQQVQRDLPALVNGALFSTLWQYLPLRHGADAAPLTRGMALTDDALEASALALLEGQWDNEQACALAVDPGDPARRLRFIEKCRARLVPAAHLRPVLGPLLDWDRHRRQAEIILGGAAPGQALKTLEAQQRRLEKALLALLDAKDPGQASQPYQHVQALAAQRQAQEDLARQWTQADDMQLLDPGFWQARPDNSRKRATLLLQAQSRALRYDAQLQQRLKQLPTAHLQRLEEVLDKPLASERVGSDTCVLRVSLGSRIGLLLGVFVVTREAARHAPSRAHPALLVVMGREGGLAPFASLDALVAGVRASLSSRDGSALWACIGRDTRPLARALLNSLALEFEVEERNVLHEQFSQLIKHAVQLSKRLDANLRPFSEVWDPALARLLLANELRERLQVPAYPLREQALASVDLLHLGAAQAKQLPAWLASATPAQRKRYKQLHSHYLANAAAFEQRLWQLLPDLEAFARQTLIAQLSVDGVYPQVDIDQPFLDVPDDVSAHFCGWSSQCAVGERQARKVISPQRTTFSLLQLALHNLDAEAPWTEWRLNAARYLVPEWKAQLSVAYLISTLSALDLGGRYDARIRQVFYARAGLEPGLAGRWVQQRARLQLYAAQQEGLSEPAQRLFNCALAARTAEDLQRDGLHVQLCAVRLVGHTLAHDRHIAGVLVLHDTLSGRCVVYWPAAEDHPALAEYPSRNAALAALNRLGEVPAHVPRLARQVAPGWEAEALASYPGAPAAPEGLARRLNPFRLSGFMVLEVGESIARFFRSFKVRHWVASPAQDDIEAQIREQIATVPPRWLEIVPTTQCNARVMLAHARLFEIQRHSRSRANSAQALREYREERLGEQQAMTVRGLLSFVPVLGVGISLYEMLLAARRVHHSRDPAAAVDLTFVTLLAVIDVLTSFVPGPKSGAPSAARAAVRGSLAQLHRRQAALGSALPGLQLALARPLKALERFRKALAPAGAIELQGPDRQGIHVKGGEQFVQDHRYQYPVYRRQDEAVIRLKNPQIEGQDELILRIEEPAERLLGADAPAPLPGPSSGVLRPWTAAPDTGTTGWSAPSRTPMEQALRQSPVAPSAWQDWGFRTAGPMTEAQPPRRIYQVNVEPYARNYEVVHLGPDFYRLLPEGSNASSREIIFITQNRPLVSVAYVDIDRWLGAAFAEQPIPATLGADGRWTPHRVLFPEPIYTTINRAFPHMTAASRRFASERLIELADPGRSVTATHLLNIRATLDEWLRPGAVGQTDDLLRLLRPNNSFRRASLFMGFDGEAPGFTRLDFIPPFALPNSLRARGRGSMPGRGRAMQAAIRHILEQQGFVLRAIEKQPSPQTALDFLCSHPKSDNLYYILTRWAHEPSINLNSKTAIQLTDQWFERRTTSNSVWSPHFAEIRAALREKRLVRLIGGIHWPTRRPGPSVYFVKFEPVSP